MDVGQMRWRCQVYFPADTRGPDGGVVTGWTLSATVWGQLRGVSGFEKELARQIGVDVATHEVRIRYYRGVTPQCRIVASTDHETRTLNIESVVDPDGHRREMKLLCKELVAPQQDLPILDADGETVFTGAS